MLSLDGEPIEFDFFMDEDVRSKRIGVLCMEKRLTPALTQALFRVRQQADDYHKRKIDAKTKDTTKRKEEVKDVNKQMREIKWNSLNIIRSFIAQDFITQFFHYWAKGPLPIMFFNSPFKKDHQYSIDFFFDNLNQLNLPILKNFKNSQSIFFLDSFNTPAGHRFEEHIRRRNNISRCYRIDSKAHVRRNICWEKKTVVKIGTTDF